MMVRQAFRFALAPAPRAERALASHVGARRFAFNWGLALVKDRLDARQRGEEVAVPWTRPALRREWNRAKETAAPWWREHAKEAYSAGLDGLAHALKNWSNSKKGRRQGRQVGFLRLRKKGRGRESVRFTTGAIRVDDQSHVVLPRIGRVWTHEPTMALLEKVRVGKAWLRRATVSREGGRLTYKCVWYGSGLVEADRYWPSSKTCPHCGAVKEELPLWERTFRCTPCGLVLDRDEAAARNLAALAAAVAGSGPETRNARGRDVRLAVVPAVPDETGSRQRASA